MTQDAYDENKSDNNYRLITLSVEFMHSLRTMELKIKNNNRWLILLQMILLRHVDFFHIISKFFNISSFIP